MKQIDLLTGVQGDTKAKYHRLVEQKHVAVVQELLGG